MVSNRRKVKSPRRKRKGQKKEVRQSPKRKQERQQALGFQEHFAPSSRSTINTDI
jgi:hypothetical protein